MKPWEEKAKTIIYEECKISYEEANILKSGRKRKRHNQYIIPELAVELLRCLKTDDEETAKYIFLTRCMYPARPERSG